MAEVLIRIEYAEHATEIEFEMNDGLSEKDIETSSVIGFAKMLHPEENPVRIFKNDEVIYEAGV